MCEILLKEFGDALKQSEVFTKDDYKIWERELNRQHNKDEDIAVLSHMLPSRQKELIALDKKYKMCQHFPRMMQEFAKKDSDLQLMYEAKLEEMRKQEEPYSANK